MRFPIRVRTPTLVAILALCLFLASAGSTEAGKGCPANYDEWDSPACDDGNPIDGYWGNHQTWIPGLIRNSSWFLVTPPVVHGKAAWYAPGIMEATAEVRGLSLEGFVDGVSGTTCSDLGLTYWIGHVAYWGVTTWEGPFLVVDCARRGDLYGVIVSRGEAVEVGFETAERWGLVRGHRYGGYTVLDNGWYKDVVVSKYPPQVAQYFTPVSLSDWFLERVEFYFPALEVTMDPKPVYRSPSTWRIDGVNWVTFDQPDWREDLDAVRQNYAR
jgi:hypothetical protein